MEILDLRLSFTDAELLEAGKEIQRVLDLDGDDRVLPPLRRILHALDEAITAAYHQGT